MYRLDDHCILVTGGARRIGAVLCRTLHAAGADIALHYHRSVAEAHQLAAELNALRPNSVYLIDFALTDIEQMPDKLAALHKESGRLTCLINNASSFYPTPFGSVSQADWQALVGSNFKGPFFLSQAAAPYLRASSGSMINITDIHAERPLANYALYCAAKGALLTLTRALAIELAPTVRVNAIAPGPIIWPEDAQFSTADQSEIIAHTLLQRSGTPEDIASVARFLIADGQYITGQVINVDGGRTVHL